MSYIMLIIVIIANALQNIFQKQYNIKSKAPDTLLFTSISSLSACMCFLFFSKFNIDFNPEVLPYAVAFAVSYGAAVFGLINAIKYGSLAITMLVFSYSLLVPTLYGIVFLHDRLSVFAYVGIFLLLISLYLINVKKSKSSMAQSTAPKDTSKSTSKWLFFLLLSFFGNGFCGIIQKMQQIKFDGGYKNELMIISLFIDFIVLLTAYIIISSLSGNKKRDLKSCLYFCIPNGISNSVVNYFLLILTGILPNAILFPCISAGGIVISFIIAALIYKEHLSKPQIIGYIIGIISVILLNL